MTRGTRGFAADLCWVRGTGVGEPVSGMEKRERQRCSVEKASTTTMWLCVPLAWRHPAVSLNLIDTISGGLSLSSAQEITLTPIPLSCILSSTPSQGRGFSCDRSLLLSRLLAAFRNLRISSVLHLGEPRIGTACLNQHHDHRLTRRGSALPDLQAPWPLLATLIFLCTPAISTHRPL